MPDATSEELAWTRNIPIVSNRYVWIHWGWASLLFVGIFTVLFAIGAAVFAPGTSYTLDTLIRIYVVLAILIAGAVIGTGLFGALSVTNKLTSTFTLNVEGARSEVASYSGEVRGLATLFGEKGGDATATAWSVGALLPESGAYEWKDIRSADYDERRHVVTLHRGWHRRLRLYATPENYEEVAAFVRGHVHRPLTGVPPEMANR